ncbi:MAG TPA: HAD-IIB family hydrolase [Polyangia bacterium]|jgi:hypothetical protein|nr:HAD-IIB family hydrolase [Polyangia bacterium]
MRYHVLASDYDGTLASDGRVEPAMLAALERVRASGRKVLLVTGRQVDDLLTVFPQVTLFDRVVAENGAVIYNPTTRERRALAEPPRADFVALLRKRGVEPLAVGQVIVATWQPHEATTLDVIRTLGLELQVIFNKGAVMVLPSGINKAFGLQAALAELGLHAHDCVGVGDAENDHAFLAVCECAVAVANALPMLKDRADLVTTGARGDGVRELCDALVDGDLAAVGARLGRHDLTIGHTIPDGQPVNVAAYGPPLLITGTSGGGKSTLATTLLEALGGAGYQYCVVDPEGDHSEIGGAAVLGGAGHPPGVQEVLEVLATPGNNAIANLVGVSFSDRPAFLDALLPRLQEMRARTGRPHWIVVDEAHHLLPHDRPEASSAFPAQPHNLVLITVHPEHVSTAVLRPVRLAIAIGAEPARTLAEFARALGVSAPAVPLAELPRGEALAWRPEQKTAAVRFKVDQPRAQRRRHIRKYATGELGPDRSFYFRGPGDRLNLRAQNLAIFLQVADGVDDETWLFHLRRGDYARWFRDSIKDAELAGEVAAVASSAADDPVASRQRIRSAVEQRYTAPE